MSRCALAACLAVAVMTVPAALPAADDAAARPTGSESILPKNAELEELWNEGSFTEGVAAGPDGKIYFSDIAFEEKLPGKVMVFDPATGKTSVHCPDSGKSNGLMFDSRGRLLAACGAMGGKRALVEILPDGKVKVIVDSYKGKKLNAPNDLVVHPDGSIYFSDPRYAGNESMELDHMSVYRYETNGKLTRVTTDIEKPNGVHVSPDGKTLYVAETNNGSTDVRNQGPEVKPGRMTLNAFPIHKDGTLGEKRVLADFGDEVGTDGMSIDTNGNIYAAVRRASRHGIVVFNPQGKELAYIPTPSLPTNASFGLGDDIHTLYVTSGKGLYRIRLKSTGFHPAVKLAK